MRTRVLVLDDQKYLRDIIAAVLDDAGYPSVAVGSPDEALRCLDELQPEMLVLDMSLPGMSGLEFLDKLRAAPEWETLPVIVVSGDPGKIIAVQGRAHVGTLMKPFDVAVLIDAAQAILGPPALTQSA